MKHKLGSNEVGDLIDLGAASEKTGAMTYGADDHKAGLWLMAGLSAD